MTVTKQPEGQFDVYRNLSARLRDLVNHRSLPALILTKKQMALSSQPTWSHSASLTIDFNAPGNMTCWVSEPSLEHYNTDSFGVSNDVNDLSNNTAADNNSDGIFFAIGELTVENRCKCIGHVSRSVFDKIGKDFTKPGLFQLHRSRFHHLFQFTSDCKHGTVLSECKIASLSTSIDPGDEQHLKRECLPRYEQGADIFSVGSFERSMKAQARFHKISRLVYTYLILAVWEFQQKTTILSKAEGYGFPALYVYRHILF
ncbi:hypothetical protein COOONC_00703 [Cooperia oncophora]